MKFILNNDKLIIEDKTYINSGSIKFYEIEVEHNNLWNDLIIEARLIKEDSEKGVALSVINNKVYVDKNISGNYFIGFIGYKLENNEKIYQISTNAINLYFQRGGGEIEISDEDLPSISQWDIYIAQIQDITRNLENEVKIVERKLERGDFNGKNGKDGISPEVTITENSDGALITITDANGTTSAQIYNGYTPVKRR